MELTEFERISLANQYQIRKALSSDVSEQEQCEKNIEILLNGYEPLYSNLEPYLEENNRISNDEIEEVINILSMFRAIHYAIADGVASTGLPSSRLQFDGFDGNHEGKQLGFVNFYIKPGSGMYEESSRGREDLNSHAPYLDTYRGMLSEWEKSQNKQNLTREDLERITGI